MRVASRTAALRPRRQERKPFLLVDFADHLSVNVYFMGATYLALLGLLRLEAHPAFQRPVDPSLFIHRYADRLGLGKDGSKARARLRAGGAEKGRGR